MSLTLNFRLPEKLFLRDPQETSYGKRLLSHAIEVIDDLGFEAFTFKKLAKRMDSSEVSIYRYFENKHLLLLYLNCWYWEWVSYLIDLKVMNVTDAEDRLKRALHCMIHASTESELTEYINEARLYQIIVKEGSKTYHVAAVDEENKYGYFLPFKDLVGKVAAIVQEINPNFPYAHSLITTLFEMINDQTYYIEHLPRLSSLKENKAEELEKMVNHFAFAAIKA